MIFVTMVIVDDLPVEVLLAFHFYDWKRGRRRGRWYERYRRMPGAELREAVE
jgi:hypothetical protein